MKRHKTRGKALEFGEIDMRRWWNEEDFIGIISEKIFDEVIYLEDAVDIILKDITQAEK